MQVEVHEGQAPRPRDELLAVVGTAFEAPCKLAVYGTALCLVHQPLVGGDKKPSGAAGGVAYGELLVGARVWLDATHDGLDKKPGREVLAGALFSFACGFL